MYIYIYINIYIYKCIYIYMYIPEECHRERIDKLIENMKTDGLITGYHHHLPHHHPIHHHRQHDQCYHRHVRLLDVYFLPEITPR